MLLGTKALSLQRTTNRGYENVPVVQAGHLPNVLDDFGYTPITMEFFKHLSKYEISILGWE